MYIAVVALLIACLSVTNCLEKKISSCTMLSPCIFNTKIKMGQIQGFFVHISRHLFFTVKKYSHRLGYLNRVSSISLLLPPRRPSPTKGFLSWLSTLRWQGPSRRHPRKLPRTRPDYKWVLGSFCGWLRDGPYQRRVPSQLKKPLRWGGPVRRKEQGNGQD